jgi:SAM-dependent methyltransferase
MGPVTRPVAGAVAGPEAGSVAGSVGDDATDPYLDGTYRWWQLSRPSPELAAAQADGWIGLPGVVVDLGCGLGWELRYLVAAGWTGLGVDLSATALRGAAAMRYAVGPDRRVAAARADVLRLPVGDARADLLLDRGCFHYLPPDGRDGYAAEARRVLRPGGRFLLRACRTAAGVANDLSAPVIERVFAGWSIESITSQDIVSDTRRMPSLTVRLIRPQRDQ